MIESSRGHMLTEKNLSTVNQKLITNYDVEMVTIGLKKSTRAKQIAILIDITIRISKNWHDVVKEDIDRFPKCHG